MVLKISILLRLRHRDCQSERLTDRNATTTKKEQRNSLCYKKIIYPKRNIFAPKKNIFDPKELKFAPKELEFAPKLSFASRI